GLTQVEPGQDDRIGDVTARDGHRTSRRYHPLATSTKRRRAGAASAQASTPAAFIRPIRMTRAVARWCGDAPPAHPLTCSASERTIGAMATSDLRVRAIDADELRAWLELAGAPSDQALAAR